MFWDKLAVLTKEKGGKKGSSEKYPGLALVFSLSFIINI